MSAYWLGVLTLPAGVVAVLLVVLACWGIREIASRAFGRLLRWYPPIKDGEDRGFYRTATDFGHRSTFAAMALGAKSMRLFEPVNGLGIFIMAGRPKEHTAQSRRAKDAIERAYGDLLKQEDQA